MKEIATEIDINATADEVWSVLTDFGSYPQWNPFITRAQGEIANGASLRVRIEPPGGKGMTFSPKVIRAQPATELRWLGHLWIRGVFDGEHIFEIETREDEGVRFHHREQFSGILVPLLWRSLDTNARRGFELMNEALKRRVEQQG